ncbi:MAG: FkbM family methyltransferase [Bacteroidota bacterium]
MYILVRSYLRKVFNIFNLGLIKKKDLNNLYSIYIEHISLINKLDFYIELRDTLSTNLENSITNTLRDSKILYGSKSETGQDFFALSANKFKTEGTFLEFGAYNGVNFSNTYLLEKRFGWNGVLIDPIPSHFESMKLNRKCKCIHAAVTAENESFVNILESPASNLSKLADKKSLFNKIHKVQAFTLTEILDEYFPAKNLDFLSIDTEGNDLDILQSINFDNYIINAICVEHNNRIGSEKIINHMKNSGYDLAWSDYSKNDYWFIRRY